MFLIENLPRQSKKLAMTLLPSNLFIERIMECWKFWSSFDFSDLTLSDPSPRNIWTWHHNNYTQYGPIKNGRIKNQGSDFEKK